MQSVLLLIHMLISSLCAFINKKISWWDLSSLGQVYVGKQRREFQVAIQLSRNVVAHYRGARICVVHSSRPNVTRFNGNILPVLFSSTGDVLLTSRATRHIPSQSLLIFLFCCFVFLVRKTTQVLWMSSSLSNRKDKSSGWQTTIFLDVWLLQLTKQSSVAITANNGTRREWRRNKKKKIFVGIADTLKSL